jgi:hypothetical protein
MADQQPTPEQMMAGMTAVVQRQMKYVILILLFLVSVVAISGGLGYQSITIIAAVCFGVTVDYVMLNRFRRTWTRFPTDKP